MSGSRDGGYREEFFDALTAQEDGHFWFESRNRLILWALARYFPAARTFLDVGCGTGFVLRAIAGAMPQLSLVATEMFAAGIAVARARVPSAQFLQADARALELKEAVDAAGIFDVLEHIPEDDQVLARVYDAVRPGGGLLVTVPQHPWLWSAMDDYSCHVRRYRRRDLADRIRGAGFDIVRMTSFISLLLPLMALSRTASTPEVAEKGPARELSVRPGLNRALTRVLDAERGLIRAGVSFPAGGSLLVVAKKPSDRPIL